MQNPDVKAISVSNAAATPQRRKPAQYSQMQARGPCRQIGTMPTTRLKLYSVAKRQDWGAPPTDFLNGQNFFQFREGQDFRFEFFYLDVLITKMNLIV